MLTSLTAIAHVRYVPKAEVRGGRFSYSNLFRLPIDQEHAEDGHRHAQKG
jgi:hypothetical protein